MAIGRTPVARGSRVPPWPTLRAWVMRRTRLTASVEVMPAGLSRHSQPWIGRPLGRAIAVLAVRSDGGPLLREQRLDARRLGERGIGAKLQVRRVLEPQAARELAAQERRRPAQRFQALGTELAAQLGDEHH